MSVQTPTLLQATAKPRAYRPAFSIFGPQLRCTTLGSANCDRDIATVVHVPGSCADLPVNWMFSLDRYLAKGLWRSSLGSTHKHRYEDSAGCG